MSEKEIGKLRVCIDSVDPDAQLAYLLFAHLSTGR